MTTKTSHHDDPRDASLETKLTLPKTWSRESNGSFLLSSNGMPAYFSEFTGFVCRWPAILGDDFIGAYYGDTEQVCLFWPFFLHSRPVCLVTFFYLTSRSTQVFGVASSPVWNKRGYQPTPSAHEGWRGQPVIRPIVSFGRSYILSRLPYGFVLYPCYPLIITSSLPFKIMHNCPCGFIYPYIRHYRP